MKSKYDFSDAAKNPSADKVKNGYTVKVPNGPDKKNNKPEKQMRDQIFKAKNNHRAINRGK